MQTQAASNLIINIASHPAISSINDVLEKTSDNSLPSSTLQDVEERPPTTDDVTQSKPNLMRRFWLTSKSILLSSYLNILLVFVPLGIAFKYASSSPGLIFTMNAIAIIPLAGLLSYATESVAKRMGDTIGALMNVTFGNAIELIIFMYVYFERDQGTNDRESLYWQSRVNQARHHLNPSFFFPHLYPFMYLKPCTYLMLVIYSIALQKGEIRIVQASLLGSILANLLLILGMCFLFGGLRFREQIYNSTVTQMSACLLSLSVMSLLLPTAFHASFNNLEKVKANSAVLKVSRGTSVVLLVIYILYLLFQLKSHAYMYESTPQHIIDEELAPGPVAAWMDSSSDDMSSDSDSDTSGGSHTIGKRVRKHRRRTGRSSIWSLHTRDNSPETTTRASSHHSNEEIADGHHHSAVDTAEDGDDEDRQRRRLSRKSSIAEFLTSKRERRRERRRQKKNRNRDLRNDIVTQVALSAPTALEKPAPLGDPSRHVEFAEAQPKSPLSPHSESQTRRAFNIRLNIAKGLSQNIFTQPPTQPPVLTPNEQGGPIRRTNSLPDRLNQQITSPRTAVFLPPIGAVSHAIAGASEPPKENEQHANISRTTAVLLLVISTGLVALCAEFMVASINAVVTSDTGLSEAFIGLIILPIVGNAAEHVTAVTVAMKNKMDLAIGVAVGSSIQIALFVTPFIVLLGWCMDKEMSLFFTLFETVSLFVSAFIVNFLVWDGRSNYLEGALLCSAYVIIAVATFFYPSVRESSNLGGNAEAQVLERAIGQFTEWLS